MTGSHRGGRRSRWQLLVSVAATLVGRGYAGRHRVDAVPRPTLVPAGATPFAARQA